MAKTKYGKYITKEPLSPEFSKIYPQLTAESFSNMARDRGVPAGTRIFYIDKPFVMVDEAHTHDFHQVLAFLGSDPMNIREFDAEVELYLGEEQEKHIINKSSYVYIKPGLVHCPLNFKTINKPVVFMDIMLTAEYIRKPLSK